MVSFLEELSSISRQEQQQRENTYVVASRYIMESKMVFKKFISSLDLRLQSR